MANEIEVTARLKINDGTASIMEMAQALTQFDLTGSHYIHNIQLLSTSAEALVLGDVATLGWSFFKNLDATIIIQIIAASGETPIIALEGGEIAMFRFDTGITAPFVDAASGTPNLEYLLIEN